jgi:hypothetical protein
MHPLFFTYPGFEPLLCTFLVDSIPFLLLSIPLIILLPLLKLIFVVVLQFTNVFLNELLLLKFDMYLLNVLLLLLLLLVIEEYLEMYGALLDMFDIGVIVLVNDVNKVDDFEDASVLYEL